MKTKEFFKLSTLEMHIEVLETEAYNLACNAQNVFTITGYCEDYEMYQKQCYKLLNEIKTLKL